MTKSNPALDALRYHITGAIERGEKMPICAVTKVESLDALIDLKLCTEKKLKRHKDLRLIGFY